MFISEAYAQAAPAAGGVGGLEQFQQFVPFVLVGLVFYFLMLRPQQQKAKQHRAMVTALRRGDRVIIQGAFHGTISKIIDDATVLVELADNVKIKIVRGAISEVIAKTEPVKDAPVKDGKDDSTEAAASTEDAVKPEAKSVTLLSKLLGKK